MIGLYPCFSGSKCINQSYWRILQQLQSCFFAKRSKVC